ncbi:MAG TPA: GNAT family N-acetyltransferase [Terriglobales bacterium]|nr:GNAT family N-acetyltransferase [Terriglobales bacterium]
MDFIIEPMTPEDWEQVRAIYEEGIRSGNATFETAAPGWEQWDKAHLPFCRLVARIAGAVAGWAALSPVSARKAYAGVAEASIYVSESAQGKGIGTALQQELIRQSEAQGIWTLQGVVFPENTASLALLKKSGFREVGRRERISKLDGRWRDTILLERRSLVIGKD